VLQVVPPSPIERVKYVRRKTGLPSYACPCCIFYGNKTSRFSITNLFHRIRFVELSPHSENHCAVSSVNKFTSQPSKTKHNMLIFSEGSLLCVVLSENLVLFMMSF
jgi:hypothetical protein